MNSFNLTLSSSASGFSASGATGSRTLAMGSGTLVIAGTGGWVGAPTANLTITGTGTISLTNINDKSFVGADNQTYPTLNQGGSGSLTISGSNKFADITNTVNGRVQFTGGTTQTFDLFSLRGVGGNSIELRSTNSTQVTLRKPSAWLVGANSTNSGNNTGLSFTAGSVNDLLNITGINGVVITIPASGRFFLLF
jgi:hypothetical protein